MAEVEEEVRQERAQHGDNLDEEEISKRMHARFNSKGTIGFYLYNVIVPNTVMLEDVQSSFEISVIRCDKRTARQPLVGRRPTARYITLIGLVSSYWFVSWQTLTVRRFRVISSNTFNVLIHEDVMT